LVAGNSTIPGETGATLIVDLDAIARNYQLLQGSCPHAEIGASVKADAYGLGLAPVARLLAQQGCRIFFVATPDEGQQLREILPDAEIVVLNGPGRDEAGLFLEAGLTPALNSLEQIKLWQDRPAGDVAPAYLHLDTGMNRLGLDSSDIDVLVADPARLRGIEISTVMSNLACADTPEHEMNRKQLDRFRALRDRIESLTGPLRASLANSPGIFLGSEFHFDLTRPGAALYGISPSLERPNSLHQVIEINAKVLQVRNVDTPMTVGYGAAHRVEKPTRIATVAAGYADGYPRAAASRTGGRMHASIAGYNVPLFGRVSMDLITLDITELPDEFAVAGQPVELLGPHVTPDELATSAGTIGYEILTGLGNRLNRIYKGGQS